MKLFSAVLLTFLVTSCSEAQNPVNNESPSAASDPAQSKSSTINKVVSASEFKEKMAIEGSQLIDVRTPGEVAGGKIEGSTNINFNDPNFKDQISKLDHNKPVLVYCAVGGRSARAAAAFKELGFKEVYDLQGGYNSWPFK